MASDRTNQTSHARIVSQPGDTDCLDTLQLRRLEQAFRDWVAATPRADVQVSRQRIFLIFLLIRYTGAKLHDVLALQPLGDIDFDRRTISFSRSSAGPQQAARTVPVSAAFADELRAIVTDPPITRLLQSGFDIDPAFVRRKFYERAESCGYQSRQGGPEMLRKARAVELMQGNVPLPAVQLMLGHSTPNLTSSYVSFSTEDISQITRHFMDAESGRTTSARNTFSGKVTQVQRCDIQSRVELTTIGGLSLTTVITNDSLERLGLKPGTFVTAEAKAPWIMLHTGADRPLCSAENMVAGVVERIIHGEVVSEYVLRLDDASELCAIISRESDRALHLAPGDAAWAAFTCFAIVLSVA